MPGGALIAPVDEMLMIEPPPCVFIARAAAWQPQCGQGIEKTGRQTTETAVAQPRIVLLINQLFQIQPHPCQSRFHILIDAQRQ